MQIKIQWQARNGIPYPDNLMPEWTRMQSRFSTIKLCEAGPAWGDDRWNIVLEGEHVIDLLLPSDQIRRLLMEVYGVKSECWFMDDFGDKNFLLHKIEELREAVENSASKLKKLRSLPGLGRNEIAEVRRDLDEVLRLSLTWR